MFNNQQTLITNLVANGYTKQFNEALSNFLSDSGYDKPLNEALYEYLASLGYSGHLMERIAQWRTAGYPVGASSSPAMFTSSDWTLTDKGTGGTLTVTINTLPQNNGSIITDIEYQVDGGGWVSSGLATTGSFDITGLTDSTSYFVAIRAVNDVGAAAGDYSFGGSTPQFVIDDAAQYYLSQTGKTAASARTVTMTDPVTVRDSDGLWKHSAHNLLGSPQCDTGFRGLGTTPPAVSNGVLFLGQSSASATFTTSSATGKSGSSMRRDASTSDQALVGANDYVEEKLQLSLSRPLTGSESISVFYTGSAGGPTSTIDASNSTSFFGVYGEISILHTVVTGGYIYPVIYLSGGVTSDVTVYVDFGEVHWANMGGMQNNPDTGTSFVGGTGTGPFFARPVEYAADGSASMPIAPGATNKLPNSNDFSTWSASTAAALTAAAATGPDGNSSMTKLADDNSGGTGAVSVSVFALGVTSGADNILSSVVKKDQVDFVILETGGFDAGANGKTWFNLNTGTVGTTNASHSKTWMKDLGGGLYQCSIRFQSTTDVSGSIVVRAAQADGSGLPDLDGTTSIFIGAATLEEGSFPTPYIPTNGAVTSRAAIQASTAKAMIGTDAALTKGTWVEVMTGLQGDGVTNYAVVASGSTSSRVFATAGDGRIYNYNGTSSLVVTGSDVLDANLHRVAVSFEDGAGRSITADGISAFTDTNNYLGANPPPEVWWGQIFNQTNMPGGSMIRGVMFPDRLSDAQIASITDAATIWPSWGEKSATPSDVTAPVVGSSTLNSTTGNIDLTGVTEAGNVWALVNYSSTVLTGAAIESAVTATTPDAYTGPDAVVSGSNTVNINLSGVTPGTAYLHTTIKDAAGNYSVDSVVAFTQPSSTASFLSSHVDPANWTTPGYLFSGVTVANGRTVLAVFNQGGSTIGLTGITIGGVAMTKRVTAVSSNVDVTLWDLVTSGGTADIQTTQSSSGRCGIMLWDVGSRSFVTSTTASAGTTLTLDVATTAADTVIGYQGTADGSYVSATAGGGWTEVKDELIEAGYFHSGYLATNAAGGAPEAFSISETVVLDYGLAAVYR